MHTALEAILNRVEQVLGVSSTSLLRREFTRASLCRNISLLIIFPCRAGR